MQPDGRGIPPEPGKPLAAARGKPPRLKDAIIRVPGAFSPGSFNLNGNSKPGGPYYTWGDAIILDCGEPACADFLMGQARRYIDKLPESSGICIDRMDWLRLYIEDQDDGGSWFAGQPAYFLLVSWHSLLGRLGPLVHDAGKVIFCNNHDKRIDILRSRLEGTINWNLLGYWKISP